jgi:hypothetical protein
MLSLVACGSDASSDADTDTDTARNTDTDASTEPKAAKADVDASGAGAAAEPSAKSSQAAKSQPTGSGSRSFKPFGADAETVAWSTDKFMLEGGQERYLCFTRTLDEDLVVNGYSVAGQPFVHHLIFARTRGNEPDGFAECDVAFRSGWEQLFITGAGNSALEFPEDAGHVLKKGTQLLVQMHLLNSAEKSVEGALTIDLRRSPVASPRPVSSFIIGTAAVKLPAKSEGKVVGTCPVRRDVKLIAGFPHMHLLGKKMTLEVGKSAGEMKEVFTRDPFDFDDQRIDKVELTIAAGEVARVTCTYDNTLDKEVTYGESTHDEMCFFVGFSVDQAQQGACLEVLPPNIFGGGK